MTAFRDLTEAQDLNTEAGRELYATLLQLGPQFAAVSEYEQRLAEARAEAAAAAAAAAAEAAEARRVAFQSQVDEIVAQREAEQAARESFVNRIESRLNQLTDSPEQALARERDALVLEANQLGASSDNVVKYYEFQIQSIRNAETAREEAEAAAVAAQARAFETRTLGAIHNLTDTPIQAITRRRDALVAEGSAVGADTGLADRLYEVQVGQIREQQRQREEAAAQARAEAARRQREAEQQALNQQYDSFYNTFYSREEKVVDTRRKLLETFSELGLALPNTRQAFRELIESADQGSPLFKSLLGVADQFAFITDGANNLNEALGASQRIFRDLREELFVASAQNGIGTDGVSIGGSGADRGILIQILQAVQRGDINASRQRTDQLFELREQNRELYEPTQQTVT